MTSQDVVSALEEFRDQQRAEVNAWFFKTAPGEYAEGDEFIGVTVPQTRKVAKQFKDISLDEAVNLLHSNFHEVRLTAIHILCDKYKRGDEKAQQEVFLRVKQNLKFVNNWDLVDTLAPHIIGPYFYDRDRSWLHELVDSGNLWRQRIAIISTYYFIKQDDFDETLKISEKLLGNEHDLIHKAVGWMLREVGNRDREVEEEFLRQHYQSMPRTMLRYAIEKFPESLRQDYLKGRI